MGSFDCCWQGGMGLARRADVEVTLTLHELYETKDVSFEKNQSLMKKQIVEGQGYETPKDSRPQPHICCFFSDLLNSQRFT